MRVSRLLSGAMALLLVAIALPATGAAQGPDRVLASAIAALGELTSYQIDIEMRTPYFGDTPVTSRRLVATEPELAYRDQAIVEGEVAVDTITTTDGAWMSTLGTPWIVMETGPNAFAEERHGAAIQRLQILVSQGLVFTEVGPEVIDERPVIRYTGTLPPASGSEGTVDLWIDAAEGWPVKAVADLRLAEGAVDPYSVPTLPTHEVVTVSRVDDPTIVIEPPDLDASPAPIPPGDPALAETVTRAFSALTELPSYVATAEDGTMGYASTVETVVVNGDPPAVFVSYALGDTVTMQALAMSGSVQTREGTDGAWSPASVEQLACDDGPCDLEGLTTFDHGLRGRAGTFTLVSDTEQLDGVPVLHLRSEAGRWLPQAVDAPGTTDLWIAKDGGHLLRMDFDGQGTRTSLVISHIGDPANGGFATYAPPPSPASGG